MKKLIIILAVAVVTASCGILQNIDTGRVLYGAAKVAQAASITDEQVIASMQQYVAKLDASNKVSSANSTYSKRLAKLTQGLTDADGIPLNFKVYETNQVNAFACADGSVRVFSGLMDLLTDDEVLGVIGHEIGHVALRHSKKEVQNAMLRSAALDGLAATSTTIASLTDSQLGAIGEAALSARYSKKQENQADDYGYDFLKAHGRNPVAMIKSFQKMQALQNASGVQATSGYSQMFSSHPDTATRIERLTQRAIADGYIKVQQQ
ncbi:MAG: M48 family metallopeptidase [Bacteroidales bacterium]|nr:M48 family metallopeptidase [Bacteroidales bacterium]